MASNGRDPKFFDIYRLDATGYARTLVYENKDGYFPSDVSDDGKWALAALRADPGRFDVPGRRHGLIRKLVDDREMKDVNMKVKDVEFLGALADLF